MEFCESNVEPPIRGRIERAWATSFMDTGGLARIEAFTELSTKLMDGYPVGAAMEPFRRRYLESPTEWIALMDSSYG